MKLSRTPNEAGILTVPDKLTQIGILGCSDIARRKFIPALANSNNAVLLAVASRDCKNAAPLPTDCRITSYDELLAAPQVDLVYLSLPNHLHEEWSIKTLEAGKHLICEKPLATSLASAEKILDCARRNSRLIYENQMFLHHPQHSVVKAMIEAGKIGKIRELRSFFGFPLPQKNDFRLDPSKGGGAFNDLARYPLGIACYLLSALPHNFSGHSTWSGDLNTGVSGSAITAHNEILSFSIRFGQQYEALYEVIGETGRIRLERAYTTPAELENRISITNGDTAAETVVPAADHFRLMIENICTIIQTGSDFSFLNRQAATIAKLAELMKRGCMEQCYAA